MKTYTITYFKAGFTYEEDIQAVNISDARIKFLLRKPECIVVKVNTKVDID